jgi:hypothetical protein
VESQIYELTNDLGRTPTNEEVAAALGLGLEEYYGILSELKGANLFSLDEAALFQVADCSATDVGLCNLAHLNGSLHPGLHAKRFQGVLECQGIDHRSQHTHVIGSAAIHAFGTSHGTAPDISSAYNDGYFNPQAHHAADLLGDVPHYLRVYTKTTAAQCFSTQLENHSLVLRL